MNAQATRALWGALLWMASGAAAAEMFRCHQPDGAISFQQQPCALPEMSAPVPAPRPAPAAAAPAVVAPRADAASAPRPTAGVPAPRPAAAAPARPSGLIPPQLAEDQPVKPTRRKREVLDLTVQLERCRADLPGFADKSAAVYQAWRQRHAATLVEHDKALWVRIRAARRGEASAPLALCTDDWLRNMESLSRMPDPRFATVEKTWQAFVGALLMADRQAVLDCLAGKAEARWKERVDSLADEDLRRMARSFRSFKVRWGDDYEKDAVIEDDGNRAGAVGFRNRNEEWKITEFGTGPVPQPSH